MAKKNLEPIVLCDTSRIPTRKEFEEFVNDNEFADLDVDNDDDYWDFVQREQEGEWDDLLSNCKYSESCNVPVLITGFLGLWNGRPEINPVRMDNVSDALQKCLRGGDDIKVIFKDGHLEVEVTHHDGKNCFEIHQLSKAGQKRTSDWYDGVADSPTEVKKFWLKKWTDYLF